MNDKLRRVVPLVPAPSYQPSWAPSCSPHFYHLIPVSPAQHQSWMAQKLAEYVLVDISDCGTTFSLKAFPWHHIVLSFQRTAEHLLCARHQWTDTMSFKELPFYWERQTRTSATPPQAEHRGPARPVWATLEGVLCGQVFDKCHGVLADWGLKGNIREQKMKRKRQGEEASIYSWARHCHVLFHWIYTE